MLALKNISFCIQCFVKKHWIFFFILLIFFKNEPINAQSSFFKRYNIDFISSNYYNDSIYFNDNIGDLGSDFTDSLSNQVYLKTHIISKFNIKSKQYYRKYLRLNLNSSIYSDTGAFIIHNRYGHLYGIHIIYLLSNPSQEFTIINRLDTNYNIIWSRKLLGRSSLDKNYLNQFIDSTLIISVGQTSTNTNYLLSINPNGTLNKIKKFNGGSQTRDFFIRDTFIYSFFGKLTRIDRYLNPINSVAGAAGGIQIINTIYINLAISRLKSGKYIFNENTWNLFSDHYYTITELDLSRMYKLELPQFNYHNFFSISIDQAKQIHIYYFTTKFENYYGIRYMKIASDWKTILKNTFYGFPIIHKNIYNQLVNGINNNFIAGQEINQGGFYNDTTYFNAMDLPPNKDDTFPSGKFNLYSDVVYIKNHDFSIFPYSQEICGESFHMDTFYPTAVSNPVLLDTMFALDTFSCSYTHGLSRIDTPVSASYGNIGFLSAHFSLAKDTYCGTKLDLRSDTSLKLGESRWHLNYYDAGQIDTFVCVDTLGYSFKYSGHVAITHIHNLRGCTDTFRDTVIYAVPTSHTAKKDTAICSPVSYKISPFNLNYHQYRWQDGSQDTSYTATDTGLYWVEKTSVCGIKIDTIRLTYKTPRTNTPVFPLDSLIFCGTGLPYTLSSGITGPSYSFTWSSGDMTATKSLASFGTYRLTVTDGCHSYIDSFRLIAKVVATPPTIPDSVALCASTFTIYKPQNLKLEELSAIVPLWQNRDSIVLTKNKKIIFRWTDSCGAQTLDTIYDYQLGSFPSYPKTLPLCEIFATSAVNTNPNITQYELSGSVPSWQINNNATLKLGLNYLRRDDLCGNQQFDTIIGISTKQPLNLIAQDSLILCPKAYPICLSVSDTFRTYRWSDGSMTDSTFQIANNPNPRIYQVTVTNSCDSFTDQVIVKTIPITAENPLALDSIPLCINQLTTKIQTSLVYPLYIWNNMPSPAPFITIDTTVTLVRLEIPRICDTLRDKTKLAWLDPPVNLPIYTIDSTFCDSAQGAVKLSLTNIYDYLSYRWKQTLDTIPSQFVNSYQKNPILLTNLCRTIEYTIPAYFCPMHPIGLPNSFSPNGEGEVINETFGIQGSKSIKIHKFMIYNRWGIKVYESNLLNQAWDGKYNGYPSPQGVYRFYLDYEYKAQGLRKEYQGTVNLLR